jgi:Family of unknown function (DUF6093)
VAVLRGRAAAEALMVDEWVVRRPGSVGALLDEVTGQWSATTNPTIYEGKVKLQLSDSKPLTPQVAERQVKVSEWSAHVPVLTGSAIRSGDVAEITACMLDPSLVGKKLVIQAPHDGSFKTARRLVVTAEVSAWK